MNETQSYASCPNQSSMRRASTAQSICFYDGEEHVAVNSRNLVRSPVNPTCTGGVD